MILEVPTDVLRFFSTSSGPQGALVAHVSAGKSPVRGIITRTYGDNPRGLFVACEGKHPFRAALASIDDKECIQLASSPSRARVRVNADSIAHDTRFRVGRLIVSESGAFVPIDWPMFGQSKVGFLSLSTWEVVDYIGHGQVQCYDEWDLVISSHLENEPYVFPVALKQLGEDDA